MCVTFFSQTSAENEDEDGFDRFKLDGRLLFNNNNNDPSSSSSFISQCSVINNNYSVMSEPQSADDLKTRLQIVSECQETGLDPNVEIKRKKFEAHRKAHYNEYRIVQEVRYVLIIGVSMLKERNDSL